MPWHLSKSDPRKVYDSRHEVVCVAQTAEQAALIVESVNLRSPQTIRLREPDRSGLAVSDATADAGPLDTFDQDNCCGPHLSKAGRAGVLAALTSFDCPRCDTQWTPTVTGPIRHWSPVSAVMIFK
jgi:hypothetical protein